MKKAVAERLAAAHGGVRLWRHSGNRGRPWHSGSYSPGRALLTLDTSGDGLHKRGYRPRRSRAADGDVGGGAWFCSRFWGSQDRLLIDPMCGSGTILIEASMIGQRMAPGLRRCVCRGAMARGGAAHWQAARQAAEAVIDRSGNLALFGYDIDAEAIRVAKQNAELAGVASDITFEQKALAELWIDQEYGI